MLTVDVDDLGFLLNRWTSWQLVNIHGVLHRLLGRRGQERAKEVFIGCNLCLLVFFVSAPLSSRIYRTPYSGSYLIFLGCLFF